MSESLATEQRLDVETRSRVTVALLGLAVILAAVVPTMTLWAPTWFAIAWAVTYTTGLMSFIAIRLRTADPRLEFGWIVVASVIFSAIPLSTVVFDGSETAIWASGAVMAFLIANVIASRNTFGFGDWRVPIVLMAIALAVSAFIVDGVALGCGVLGIAAVLIMNGDGTRARIERIQYERDHDELTGLMNRRGLLDYIDQLADGPLTIVMIDANRFKSVNDTYGYEAGDVLLQEIGRTLADRLGPDWKLARQGGDEFVAVAPGHLAIDDALAEPVSVTVPYRDAAIEIELAVAVGTAHASNANEADQLLSRAGLALRSSKRLGGVAQFDNSAESRFTRALELADASVLDETNGLYPAAQAIVDARGTIVGWELLARWRTEEGELLMPADFLPLLAESGLMPRLNDRMLEAGVAFAARFNGRVAAPFVSVNVTASHLGNPALVGHVRLLLEAYEVPASRLMIEITESEGLGAVASWRATARWLVQLGVKLAIDDFGSGYSSIERMNQLPITHLKFDRSFVHSLDGPFGEVVRGLARYADATGLGVIAEGIETAEELEAMCRIGVVMFQGWHFGKAEPLDAAERRLLASDRA